MKLQNKLTYLECLADTIRTKWDDLALVDYSPYEDYCSSYTFGEMYKQMCRVSDILRHLNISQGNHVALCGANSSHWMLAYLSVAKIRAVNVSIMHTLDAHAILSSVEFSDAKILFVDQLVWNKIRKLDLPNHLIVISLEHWDILWNPLGIVVTLHEDDYMSISSNKVHFAPVDWETPAQICFTSGTSDSPKAVLASWKNLTCNILCASENYKATRSFNMLSVFPLGHMLAIIGEFLSPLHQGCTVYILRGIVEPNTLLDAYVKIEPYEIVLVPMVVERFLSSQYIDRFKQVIQSLEIGVVCGAKLKKELEEQLIELNFPLTVPYGMTECGPLVSIVHPTYFEPFSSGKVCQLMQVKIGEADEILVKGSHVMIEYYKNKEATNCKIDSDGWMHTGDCGYMDENGNLFVRGRIKNDIFVLPSGENVSPMAMESIINSILSGGESIVVLRDEHLVALIYSKGVEFDSKEILSQMNKLLPSHCQLFDVEFLKEPLQRTEKQNIKRYLYN